MLGLITVFVSTEMKTSGLAGEGGSCPTTKEDLAGPFSVPSVRVASPHGDV
jgi:hypothetical protein